MSRLTILGRIIPADAGSTHNQTFLVSATKDHPRGCGEHPTPIDHSWMSEGSSPRMRGAPRGVTNS